MKIRLLLTLFGGLVLSAMAGAQNNVTRSLPSFNKIAISGGYDAVLLQEGSSEGVTLELNGVDADKIITEVKGSTLEIGMKKGSYNGAKIRMTITYKKLKEIASSGSSNIEALSVIKGNEFEIATSGSGDFKGTFDVKDLDVAISGSSKMVLKGSAAEQEFAVSGSGNIDAGDLTGKTAEVAISGSGNVLVGVDGPVQSAVSGSGKVTSKKK
ncbi:MAG: DUF2807 domain-containing protein [Saprospiraceae bacterium]|nr:DUF2807 domain-containing protein [Saprospiraceae bacterium]